MEFILELIVTAGVLLLASKMMSKVEVHSTRSAFIVALLIGILNPTIGLLLRGVFHVFTLGIPLLIGLGFLIRLLVTAIIIKLVDAFVSGFKVHGFTTGLLLAVMIAMAGTIVGWIF